MILLKKHMIYLALLAMFCLFPSLASALEAKQLLLIANRHMPAGIALAMYYAELRGVPADQLLLVDLPVDEDCSRIDYTQRLLSPLRQWLAQRPELDIRCLVLFYGLPLRVAPPLGDENGGQGGDRSPLARVLGAAVDSELSLVRYTDYPLPGWVANPLYRPASLPPTAEVGRGILLVSRLDGSSPAVVKRIVDDSLKVELSGLQGRAYFDARWPLADDGTELRGYALYDASLHHAAELTGRFSRLEVVLDQREDLFAPGTAPDAALYSGWYSLARYVPAFTWRPGAVAYHMASAECATLKEPRSEVWCKKILDNGGAATIGPVAEPFIQGFPLPEEFFSFLLDGHYSLVESYYYSLPYLSWQMILVGDPLYRPFGSHSRGAAHVVN